jgi:hypothetical protein
MLSSRSFVSSTAALLLSACATASGTFVPLSHDHPATAGAPELPIVDPSAFLRADAGEELPPMQPAAPSDTEESPPTAGGFVCPMHPEVTSGEPGRCPECGMKLVPREKSEEHPHGN